MQLAITLGFAAVWWAVGAEPSAPVQVVLLAANAVSLGIQSSAVQRLGQSGLSTTYLTGTLTTLVVRLATGHRLTAVATSLQILAALVAGAALGAALADHLPRLAPVPQLLCLTVVVVAGLRVSSRVEAPHGVSEPAAPPTEPSQGRL